MLPNCSRQPVRQVSNTKAAAKNLGYDTQSQKVWVISYGSCDNSSVTDSQSGSEIKSMVGSITRHRNSSTSDSECKETQAGWA